MTNVRAYTDHQLLNRVRSLETFRGIPNDYWIIGVRSNEDEFNKFDDKFYLFNGRQFVKVMPGTTNAGSKGLKEFHTYNEEGVAVLKADHMVYNFWERGMHRGKILAFRQRAPWPYYRDNNYNDKNEEIGLVHNNIIFANFHPASYLKGDETPKEDINGWSLACQVPQIRRDFDDVMNYTEGQQLLTYALLNEFEV